MAMLYEEHRRVVRCAIAGGFLFGFSMGAIFILVMQTMQL